MADGVGFGHKRREKESDHQNRLHELTIVGNVEYDTSVVTIGPGGTPFTIGATTDSPTGATIDHILGRFVSDVGGSIILPTAQQILRFLQTKFGGSYKPNLLSNSSRNHAFRMEFRNHSTGNLILTTPNPLQGTQIVPADNPAAIPQTYTIPAGVTAYVDVYAVQIGQNPQVVYEVILFGQDSRFTPIVPQLARNWVPAAHYEHATFSNPALSFVTGVDADGVTFIEVVNDQAATVTVTLYYEIEGIHDQTPNKHWSLQALQSHIAPYNQNGAPAQVFNADPTIQLTRIVFNEGPPTTTTSTSVTGSVSGVLNNVTGPPSNATAPKFRYLSFDLSPNNEWLSGVFRTKYQLRITLPIVASAGGSNPTVRIYGINYDFFYDYR